MTLRQILYNWLFVLVGLVITILIYALENEQGDWNAASMYFTVSFLPILICTAMNALVLTFLLDLFDRIKITFLAFLVPSILVFVFLLIIGPIKMLFYMALCLTIINLLTFLFFKASANASRKNAKQDSLGTKCSDEVACCRESAKEGQADD
jgi:hypothetical protein